MSALLKYSVIHFSLFFEQKISFKIYPTFIIHSVLGKELKQLSCIFRNKECSECPVKFTCPYSYIFETPVKKDDKVFLGRNKAPHPYVISSENYLNEETDNIKLELTMFGETIKYLPYIYYALLKAGARGVFKERVKYTIKEVYVNNCNILKADGNIDMEFEQSRWQLEKPEHEILNDESIIEVLFLSPLRLKYRGKYGEDFTFEDLLNAIKRRLAFICYLYGNYNEEIYNTCVYDFEEIERRLKWLDLNYYSSRQKTAIKLGGVIGSIRVKGRFDKSVLSLLKAAELFHVGKNPSFGLGKVKMKIIEVE